MDEKYSIEETKSIRTGLTALLAVLVCVFITVSHNSSIKRKNLGRSYTVYASFGRTDGLSIGDAVRMAGVTIGRVIDAELDENFNAKLALEIDSGYKIPEDSSASIVSFGLIGGKYVEIDVGGSEEYIAPSGEISYTQDAMVLEELLDRIISMGKAKRKLTSGAQDKRELQANDENKEDSQTDSEYKNIKGDKDE